MKAYDKNGILLYNIDDNKEIARGGEGRIMEIGRAHV